jgi:hypothetical protein
MDPCPYCGDWNCSHDDFPLEIERRNNILNPPKPYTGEDKRTDKEMLDGRFKASFGDDPPPIRKRA